MKIRIVKPDAEIRNSPGCINAPFYKYQDTTEVDIDEMIKKWWFSTDNPFTRGQPFSEYLQEVLNGK